MMKKKSALITGVTGQDGAYLSQLLLDRGYDVIGAIRQSSSNSKWRLEALEVDRFVRFIDFELLDYGCMRRAIKEIGPDEIYNLAAQSFVGSSWSQPEYTSMVDGIAVLRQLEAIRDYCPEARFYQASTSEMFGKVATIPQNEETSFHPRSPYGVAKLYAHWMTKNYRESHSLFSCSGILFNHESPIRGKEFVTRKISDGLVRVKLNAQEYLELGNLDAKRDWGYSKDYVEGMWLMLQAELPDDYVLATGQTHTIRNFVEMVCAELELRIEWQGAGIDEVGVEPSTGRVLVRVSPEYYRPAEVDILCGDSSKAKTKLGWTPKTKIEDLCHMMVKADYDRIYNQQK